MDVMLLIAIILVCALSILVCAIENIRLRTAEKTAAKRVISLIGNCTHGFNA